MRRDESEILRDHGERLARIETEITNHVKTSFVDLRRRVDRIDARLWWILGTAVAGLVSVMVSLLR